LSAGELLSALLKADDPATAVALLRQNKASITRNFWMVLITEAVKSSNDGNNARTLFVLQLAKEAAELLGDKKLAGYTDYRTGYVHFALGDVKAAIDAYLLSASAFEQAESKRDLIYVLAELGNVFTFAGEYEKAERSSQESLAIAESLKPGSPSVGGVPDEYGIAYAWSTLGDVSMWRGDYIEAADRFQKALSLWEKLNAGGTAYRPHMVNALINLGIAYKMMGAHAEALKHWYQARELVKTLDDKGRLAAVLVSIGGLYLDQRDYAKASDFLNQSLRLFTEVNNRREIASTLINIGVLNQRLKDYEKAIRSFHDALLKAEEIAARDVVVAAQEGLGAVYYEQGQYAAALDWLDKAWLLAQEIDDKIRMTEILWRKAQVFYSQGDYDQASANAREAADLAGRLRWPLLTYLALTLLGDSLRAKRDHPGAFDSFRQAISAVEEMRDQIAGGEKEQQLFFEDKLSPYHGMVSLLAQIGDSEEALKYAERAKSRVLLDVLRHGRIGVNRSLTQNEQAEERRLYSEMVALNAQIRVERTRPQPDDERIDELEMRLRKARNAYEGFKTTLYAAHPELKARRGELPAFTIDDAKALVSDTRTTVLEYVVTDRETFLFALTRNSRTRGATAEVKVHTIRISRDELSSRVEKHLSLLSSNHPGFRDLGRNLYDLLIKPAEPYLTGKTTVCIVPDGPLWNLSFQALQTERDQYMLERFAVYYAPSLQVLRDMRKRSDSLQRSPLSKRAQRRGAAQSSEQLRPRLYAVGNPAFGGEGLARAVTSRNAPFVPLPETEREVQTLASEVYGPQASLVRIGADAREEDVKAEMRDYQVLHFATHGVLDNDNPLYSYIVLASSAGSGEDGLLEAWELMEMDLKADLAVLSACETARGRVGDGEGMIGMTWALFVAGVPTMIASQWRVPSESTTKLMVAFHKNAAPARPGRKVSKAEAWRRAALAMIRDPRYRNKPYYWAGFVVMGNGGN
jgi:CHAT domain-containing protein/uncharacterized protein HemY